MPVNMDRFNFDARKNARLSSVLILLYDDNGDIRVPLIERQKYEGVHSGQISLPGGKHEPGDKNLIDTAIRETCEEIGVPGSRISVIGTLSEIYIPPSNFKVLPVVGYASTKPEFQTDDKEVMSLIEMQLSIITDPSNRSKKNVTIGGDRQMEIPYYDVDGHTVWGATAMILSEFSTIVSNTTN